ncbi:Disease resistance protein RPM1 [Acorus calamus]|uniref:Disease resistance protein RPM1 n=1 Tax=Acorus calamus TaxID=4465 RepID=A0AAV9FE00_ACOCL|nr:Disease resistance protein RPM1 [Acorus calamus]
MWKKAFTFLPDLAKAVTKMTALKGVGPAAASAVPAAYAPEVAVFMSDERPFKFGVIVVIGDRGHQMELFRSSDVCTWKQCLSSHQSVIESLSKPNLVSLDAFYRTHFPRTLHERDPKPFITRSELTQLMQWKLTRGKWRPQLLGFVSSLDETHVDSASKKAFASLPDFAKAVTELTALKGVGPTTASAIFAAYAPEVSPFMSDECVLIFKPNLSFHAKGIYKPNKISKEEWTAFPTPNPTPTTTTITTNNNNINNGPKAAEISPRTSSERCQRSGITGCITVCLHEASRPDATEGDSAEIAMISKVKEGQTVGSIEGDTNSKLDGEDNADLRRDRDLVGMDIHMERLVEWLSQEQPRRTIISILGEGGLGKTALASKVFEEEKKARRFENYAWVSVTQSYHGADDLLRRIIHQFFEEENETLLYDISDVERWVLDNNLREFLHRKRFLLVLDDVWHGEVWTDIRLSFPNINNRSRIIVTTRHREVVSFLSNCGGGWYDLTPLDEQAASTLFHRQLVFGGGCIGGAELEGQADIIAKICRGSPLAIILMGRQFALRERTTSEWEDVVTRLDYIYDILNFSFRDLPNHLRICLLYCSAFPEAYAIKRTRLIRPWTAEGFIQERGEANPEEVAGSYLNELIFRGMLQVAKTNEFGRAREVLVPNMVRELALSMSEVENLLKVYNGDRETIVDPSDQARQIAIHWIRDDGQMHARAPQFRSLFDFTTTGWPSVLQKMKPSFRSLRVLDLKGSYIKSVPDEVLNDLYNLRYLSLRSTSVRELPRSLGRLQNLQTLDLRNSNVHALPREVLKLLKLRHLLGWDLHLQSNPDEPWCLKDIQTLKTIASNAEVVREVGNLTQLRSFWITWVRPADEAALCASIAKMTRLTNLVIVTCVEGGRCRRCIWKDPPPLLQKLGLMGRLDRLGWLILLANLKELHLTKSRMSEDPIPFLGRARQNLAYLELDEAYNAQLMRFDAYVFPTLKKLCLWNLERLEEIVIEVGAMASLVEFDLRRCGELKAVPVGMEWLANLRELYLEAMPDKLVERLRGGEGSQEDNRVGHIQLIRHWDYMRGRPLECISYKPHST